MTSPRSQLISGRYQCNFQDYLVESISMSNACLNKQMGIADLFLSWKISFVNPFSLPCPGEVVLKSKGTLWSVLPLCLYHWVFLPRDWFRFTFIIISTPRGDWRGDGLPRIFSNFQFSVFQPEEITYSDTNKSMVEDLKNRYDLYLYIMIISHSATLQSSNPVSQNTH